MAVIVQYIVERNGEHLMTFPTKKEADAYDKILDIADEIAALLRTGDLGLDDQQTEATALHLAQHGNEAMRILKGVKPKTPKPKASPAEPGADEPKPPRGRRKAETA